MSASPLPIPARFRSRVQLTIHGGFLTTAGALQCDPVAKVHIVTVKKLWRPSSALSVAATAAAAAGGGDHSQQQQRKGRSGSPLYGGMKKDKKAVMDHSATAVVTAGVVSDADRATSNNAASRDGVAVTISAKTVASTKPKYFTSRPNFAETVVFDVEDNCSLTSLASKAPSLSFPSQSSSESVEDFVVVTVEDATEGGDKFFGEAYCPFSPHCPSAAAANAPVRVMLQPRNTQDPFDPLFLRDMSVLKAHKLDDFGFLTVSWQVAMVPHGGAMMRARGTAGTADSNPASNGASAEAPSFPLGLTLKAHWQAPPQLSSDPDAFFTVAADFGAGGGDRFVFTKAADHSSGGAGGNGTAVASAGVTPPFQPLFLTIQSASQLLNVITFHCEVQSINGGAHEVPVRLPLPSLATREALDRDVHWASPVRTARGDDLGLLFATIRLCAKPLVANAPLCQVADCPRINDPLHQQEATHTVKDWSATGAGVPPLPNAPFAAYQPLLWEGPEHIAKAAERAYKRNVVLEAQPTPEHVRHVFDVLMGRVQLDAGVARVAVAFFNRAATEISAMDLKEFMVACAFNGRGLSVVEAARFCFVALRRDVEDAVAAEEVVYMFLHALVGNTVDMSEGEIKRWVNDVIGDAPAVSFRDFTNHILHNEAMWAAFGIPVHSDAAFSSAQHRHHYVHRDPLSDVKAMRKLEQGSAEPWGGRYSVPPQLPEKGPEPQQHVPPSPPPPASTGDSAHAWRTFVVRVPQTQKAFSVTAHVNDTVAEVKKMVEASTAIAAARQEWRMNGDGLVDSKATIGSTALGLPSAMKHKAGAPAWSAPSPAAAAAAAAEEEKRCNEVWIRESEETVLLHFSFKAKNKRWTEQIPVAEKVLKVRAGVQRHTLIPLSRCALRVVNPATGRAETALADRHPISHYKLQSGDVIEVSQE